MYVRWKKRERKQEGDRKYCLDAVLVESYREGDKVKQRFIKHLGTIEFADSYSDPLEYFREKHFFWQTVTESLDSLNLDSADREKIEKMISKKVPK